MNASTDPTAPKSFAEEAKISPSTVFDDPKAVVQASELTPKEKSDVLVQWEADAKALQIATDEGMSGGQRPRLDEVKNAQTLLGRQTRKLLNRVSSRATPDDAPTILTSNEARQGETGHNVRYVLGFGLFGIISAFLLLGLYYGSV